MSTATNPKKRASALEARKKMKSKILTWTCVILVFAILVGLTSISFMSDNGFFLRKNVAVESENFEVNDAMLAYFTYMYYMNFYSTYYYYLSAFGIDSSLPLNQQSNSADVLWLDYFAEAAAADVADLLIYAEAAKADGLSLSDENKKNISDSVDQFESYAAEAGVTVSSLITNVLGVSGVTIDDVRDALELSEFASLKQESIKASFSYTDEQIEDYFTKNKTSYTTVDYLTYTLKADLTLVDQTKDTFEEDLKKLYADTKAKAEDLGKCTTEEAFVNWIKASLEGSEESVITEATKDVLKTDVSFEEDNAMLTWAFEAKAGESYIDSTTEGTYIVYVLTSAAERNTKPSDADIYVLTFTDEEKAKSALETFEAGTKDKTAFEALATSLEVTSYSKEGITDASTTVDSAVLDWVFTWETKAGDYKYVTLEDSEGFALALVIEISDTPSWKNSAKSDMLSDDCDQAFEALKTQYSTTYNGYKF